MDHLPNGASTIDSGGSLRQFRDQICRSIHCIEMTSSQDPDDFRAGVSLRPFASAELMRFDVPDLMLRRTRSGIGQDERREIQITYVVGGQVSFRQNGREALVRSNDCFLTDHSSPYELQNCSSANGFCVLIPRDRLSRNFPVEDLAARKIDGGSHWGMTLAAYLRALDSDFDKTPDASPSAMIDQILLLLELALGGQLPARSTHQEALLRRTRSIMLELCHEEDLTPAMVAQIVGISKGHMNRLFARVGTTFCTELDTIRIHRACDLLEARTKRYLSINEIGIRCGLPNPPHFARKFRLLKGVAPSKYRQSKSAC